MYLLNFESQCWSPGYTTKPLEKKKPQKNVTYIYILVQSNLDYPNTGMAHQKFR